MKSTRWFYLLVALSCSCASHGATAHVMKPMTSLSGGIVVETAESSPKNPFLRGEEKPEPATNEPDPQAIPESKASRDDIKNPFGSAEDEAVTRVAPVMGDCGPTSTLVRAELRKPEIAAELCSHSFGALDGRWIFILYYVKGFNEFLEERGGLVDPTGACARAAEPRRALNLIYKVIDTILGRGDQVGDVRGLKKMIEPFREEPKRIFFLLRELSVWEKEGWLDATSVASRGMCSDPAFKLFWANALDYAKRLPGSES